MVDYTYGPHTQQAVPDLAPTVDYRATTPMISGYAPGPATQDFYVHTSTSGHLPEYDVGWNLDAYA